MRSRFGPSTFVSLHTSFFIACAGFTHGPPTRLQPAELNTVISSPSPSASAAACFTAAGPRAPPRVGPPGPAKRDLRLAGLPPAGRHVRELEAADADALHPLQVL